MVTLGKLRKEKLVFDKLVEYKKYLTIEKL